MDRMHGIVRHWVVDAFDVRLDRLPTAQLAASVPESAMCHAAPAIEHYSEWWWKSFQFKRLAAAGRCAQSESEFVFQFDLLHSFLFFSLLFSLVGKCIALVCGSMSSSYRHITFVVFFFCPTAFSSRRVTNAEICSGSRRLAFASGPAYRDTFTGRKSADSARAGTNAVCLWCRPQFRYERSDGTNSHISQPTQIWDADFTILVFFFFVSVGWNAVPAQRSWSARIHWAHGRFVGHNCNGSHRPGVHANASHPDGKSIRRRAMGAQVRMHQTGTHTTHYYISECLHVMFHGLHTNAPPYLQHNKRKILRIVDSVPTSISRARKRAFSPTISK